ncbi:N-acetyltransferase [Candidatus Parcubacteria bacterium]|nr:MAG: N-acetyltransferase [Candidatus Parcubacteria bacterium]
MEKIQIRQGTIEDFSSFYKYFKKSIEEQFYVYTPNTRDYLLEVDSPRTWFKKQIKEGKKTVFLAMRGKKTVGYLCVSKPNGGISFGNWLAVDDPYRKKGIASKLLKMWEDYALDLKAHGLCLWAEDKNVNFYKNRGFILGGTFQKAWYGIDHYLFYKTIAEPKEENYLKKYLESKSLKK